MRAKGLKITPGRMDIFNVLLKSDRPLSIQEIAKEIPEVHYVSIYRSIDKLYRGGILTQVPQGFKNLFELNDTFKPHHHHATCEKCGKSLEINDDRIESLMKDITVSAGLIPTSHHFEMYGICTSCQ